MTSTEVFQTLARDWPSLDELEERYVLAMLVRVGHNKSRAARALGVARPTLCRILARIERSRRWAKLARPDALARPAHVTPTVERSWV